MRRKYMPLKQLHTMKFIIPPILIAFSLISLAQSNAGKPTIHSCPASIAVSHPEAGPFDLAGWIRHNGTAEQALAASAQGKRDMPASCSGFANKLDCEVAHARIDATIKALTSCINKSSTGTVLEPSPTDTDKKLGPNLKFDKCEALHRGNRNSIVECEAQASKDDYSALNKLISEQGTSPFSSESPWQPKTDPALDPSIDYSGKSCSYFTKPSVDEHGTNYYADGAFSCYGKRMYECSARKWISRGPCSSYSDSKRLNAEVQEKGQFNTRIYEKE